MNALKHPLPPEASAYLKNNFPDGFLFEEFREDVDDNGQPIFIAWINDGKMLYQLQFDSFGELKHRDIIPAFEDEPFRQDIDEYHEDDY